MIERPFSGKDQYGHLWQCSYDADDDGRLPRGGLILRNLQHNEYNFAKEIRIAGIWVYFENENDSADRVARYYPISRDDFSYEKAEILFESPVQLLKRKQAYEKKYGSIYNNSQLVKSINTYAGLIKDLNSFSEYSFVKGIRAKYTMAGSFNIDSEFSRVNIEQTFLFTDYDKYPAHEPTGNLIATRLFPLVKTTFLGQQATFTYKVKSVRIDYRFIPVIDTFISGIEAKLKNLGASLLTGVDPKEYKKDLTYILNNQPQQAAVFRDRDKINFFNPVVQVSPSALGFEAAEKPLIYEIETMGLNQSFPKWKAGKTEIYGWDNLHWWGGYKEYHIPSAPGAFHALHLHWRWGKAIFDKIPGLNFPYAKKAQFKSNVPPVFYNDARLENLSGPLVDPNAWIQTIRLAVIAYDKNRLIDTTEDFFQKFERNKGEPVYIQNGAKLEFWYSVELSSEVYLETKSEITSSGGEKIPSPLKGSVSGTVFIQGMYFGHEEEPFPHITTPTRTKVYLPVGPFKPGEAEKRIKAQKRFKRYAVVRSAKKTNPVQGSGPERNSG